MNGSQPGKLDKRDHKKTFNVAIYSALGAGVITVLESLQAGGIMAELPDGASMVAGVIIPTVIKLIRRWLKDNSHETHEESN